MFHRHRWKRVWQGPIALFRNGPWCYAVDECERCGKRSERQGVRPNRDFMRSQIRVVDVPPKPPHPFSQYAALDGQNSDGREAKS